MLWCEDEAVVADHRLMHIHVLAKVVGAVDDRRAGWQREREHAPPLEATDRHLHALLRAGDVQEVALDDLVLARRKHALGCLDLAKAAPPDHAVCRAWDRGDHEALLLHGSEDLQPVGAVVLSEEVEEEPWQLGLSIPAEEERSSAVWR